MSHEDKLDDLLVQWGEARERGEHLQAKDLCADCPELAAQLTDRIAGVESARPFIELDEDSQDDVLHLPDFSTVTNRTGDTRQPPSSITLDLFCQRLVESGLMHDEQVARLRKTASAASAVGFSEQLVISRKLTRFQATVLLEGRDLPLMLDRYLILDEIGAGGMGAVYKALHQQMDRVVALKILPRSTVDTTEKVKRFQREVKAAARLEHPNIVTAFDAHEAKGIHFLVMSFVDGQDLARLVRRQGPLSVAKAVDYIAQAARGLEHAHGLGIVHRDIKPANLLLDKKGAVRILDMGLARIVEPNAAHDKTATHELTQAGMVMGTIAYLAPEQALDTRSADARSDMYSLGCTLYFLLNGKVPYNEDTMMKTIMAHREGAIPPLCNPRTRAPAELEAIFQKMVAKQPADRFQSMSELLAALETLVITDEDDQQPIAAGAAAVHNTATFIDTSREYLKPTVIVPAREKPPHRFWFIIAACLMGFISIAWVASIFLKVETAAGTIILEIDQPELTGAEVSVDGRKRITIKTGEGTESIQVEADEKTHTLKVTKGGFETFTKSFTVTTGKTEAIRVHLQPLHQQTTPSPLAESSNQTPPAPDTSTYAVSLDGIDDYIEIPTLRIDARAPLTFEAWCSISPVKAPQEEHLDPIFTTNSLTHQQAGYVLISDRPNRSYWMARQTLQDHTASSHHLFVNNVPLSEHHHIAAIWTDSENRLYLDGKLVAQGSHSLPPFRTDYDDSHGVPTLGKAALLHTPLERCLKGEISEVRLSTTVRYSDDFMPNKRLSCDADTLLLYHFDEGFGESTTDSSGNGHHGTLHGVKWTPFPATTDDIAHLQRNYAAAEWVLSVGGWVATPDSRIETPALLKEGAVVASVVLYSNDHVSDDDLGRFADLENLIVLALSNTKVSDAGMHHVSQIHTLQRLDLQNSRVTGRGLRQLVALPSLKTLWADGLQVSNADIEALAGCTQLEELSLSDPSITDDAVNYLKNMHSLQSLNLAGTSVSADGKAALRVAIPGCRIN